MRRILQFSLWLLPLTIFSSALPSPSSLHYGPEEKPAAGHLGAVASESAICSQSGTDMLKAGGNAADVMIATMFCVDVVGMWHSGMGGGGLMLIRTPDNSFEFIDFRETAPSAASEDMFKNDPDAATTGGLAVGVPGQIRGLEYVHKKYGSLPWSTLLQPAIKAARQGVPVTQDLIGGIDKAVKRADGNDFFSTDPTWAVDFAPNGTRLGLGDIITRKRFADTLETIAADGPEAFYSGPIAESTVEAIQEAGGVLTLDDLRSYTVVSRDVAEIDYCGYKVMSSTAPSCGVAVLQMLKVMDCGHFDSHDTNLSVHRLDEAMRFAYGQRTNLGDPGYTDGIDDYQQSMLNPSTIEEIRRRISDDTTQDVSAYNPQGMEILNTPGTSHISVVDSSGLAISGTSTINLQFGSRVMVPDTGIIMNNEMGDFSRPDTTNSLGNIPSEANLIRPGQRPLSSMTPTIVTHSNGTLFFITGAAGGSQIITATTQTIIHVVNGMSATEALAQPRLHDQLSPNQAEFEYGFDNATVAFMQSRGHHVAWVAPSVSSAQAIRVLPDGSFEAAAEPRQAGSGGSVV